MINNSRLSLNAQSYNSSTLTPANNQIMNSQSYNSQLQLMPFPQQNTHTQNTIQPLTPDQLNLLYSMNPVHVGYGFQRPFTNPTTYQNYNQFQHPLALQKPVLPLDMNQSMQFQHNNYSMGPMPSQSLRSFTPPIQNFQAISNQPSLNNTIPFIAPPIPQSKSLQSISNIPSTSFSAKSIDSRSGRQNRVGRDLIDLGESAEEK